MFSPIPEIYINPLNEFESGGDYSKESNFN